MSNKRSSSLERSFQAYRDRIQILFSGKDHFSWIEFAALAETVAQSPNGSLEIRDDAAELLARGMTRQGLALHRIHENAEQQREVTDSKKPRRRPKPSKELLPSNEQIKISNVDPLA